MDIYKYLKKDHDKVADLMEQVISTKDLAERQSLFETIKLDLSLHADTEEQTFYKAIDDATRSKAVEEKVEHLGFGNVYGSFKIGISVNFYRVDIYQNRILQLLEIQRAFF